MARLVLMGVAGLVSVGIVAAFAVWSSSRQAAANRDMAQVSDGMSHQWNADMMHDALRADVMSALFATTAAQRQTLAVDDVTEHASDLLGNYDAAAAEAPAGLRADYARVRPELVQYTRAATGLAGVAATDHAAAAVDLPAYLVLYHRLETELSDQDDAMMAAVQAAGDRGTRTSHTSNWIILLAGLLAPVSKGGPR